jgi:hypothetical protein
MFSYHIDTNILGGQTPRVKARGLFFVYHNNQTENQELDGGFTAARAVSDKPPKKTENTVTPKQKWKRLSLIRRNKLFVDWLFN